MTRKDVFPLPLIDECLDTLSGNVWFLKLDANSAFHQIKIRPEDRRCNAPATFCQAMNLMLLGLTWNIVLAFLDDALVLGRDFDDHLANLRSVLPASGNST